METTMLRMHKTTQSRLKKISAAEHISIMELVDKLVDEHERSFWKGFEEESTVFLDKEEAQARKTFENALGDGIGTRKTLSKKGRNTMRSSEISFYPSVFRTVGNGKCGHLEERGFHIEKGVGTLNKLFPTGISFQLIRPLPIF